MTATSPYRIDTITDAHGTYEERWMVPPPGEGVVFRVTAEAWRYEGSGPAREAGCTVRYVHGWKAVEARREL